MEITLAEIADAVEILALQKLAYQSEAAIYDDYTIPPLAQSLKGICSEFPDYTFLKAIEGGIIVGSVRAKINDGTCYIGRLIVHPDYQNRGIGSALLKEIERIHKAERYELFTGSKSERNLYLYKKHGYREFKSEDQTDKVKIVFLQKFKRLQLPRNAD
jgi:GNAT superfamily N-acetyltransferase